MAYSVFKSKRRDVALETIIIDCDPGIDDATAILLALKSGECRLEAVTTVAGNVTSDVATQNVVKLFHLLDINWMKDRIPLLAKGSSKPLFREIDFENGKRVHGQDGLGSTEDLFESFRIPKIIPTENNAIHLLTSNIVSSAEPVTLVAVGPLTNIAKCINRTPSIKEKLKKVIIMGGAIEVPGNVSPTAEFNIFTDPEAAKIVFQSELPILLVPLDVTQSYEFTKDEILEFGESESLLTKFVYRALTYYMKVTRIREGLNKDSCYLHDALAMGIAINEKLMKTTKHKEFFVDVETKGEIALGQTIADRRPIPEPTDYGPIEVCLEIDFQEFIKFFNRTILK